MTVELKGIWAVAEQFVNESLDLSTEISPGFILMILQGVLGISTPLSVA